MSIQPITFYERVEDALKNSQLHEALHISTSRLISGRRKAMAELSDSEALRDHARRIRAYTLAHLDHYLAQFADTVEQLGGQVYWAETAEEAARYVVELAQKRGVQSVVKSKSMVSEELLINHRLERAGVRVVETDLGEYIIQLANDKPSHIIAPAIHKDRHEIAALFREKLQATPEDLATVPRMTALARRTLRSDFLRADMGISGVNFGVAETGTICLVTNEGNGRLTTTLPRIHVALMGMERLVPTIDDLEVMIQLLARSASGQKMSVYTNLITGPRRNHPDSGQGEMDGPDELHVVLVDNGRTRLLGSDLAEMLYCIRCGACLNNCPVYLQIGGHAYGSVYSGPMGAVVTPGLFGLDPWSELPHASSLCGACQEVCPVHINIPRMLLRLREQGVRLGQAPSWLKWGLRLYRWAALHPFLFRLGSRISQWMTRRWAENGWIKKLPGPLSAWTDHREFPAFAEKSFRQRWQEERGSKYKK